MLKVFIRKNQNHSTLGDGKDIDRQKLCHKEIAIERNGSFDIQKK